MLECELAVVVDSFGNPDALAPAIEVVYVRFNRPEDMNAANLVLCNLGADAYIVGDFLPWAPPYDNVSVTLKRGAEVLNQASMTDALGGPEIAVPWIWQESIRRGFTPVADSLILTGACGNVVPAEAGHYEADFGALGTLRFEIGNA